MTVIDFGIVFDIDGVLYRGGELIPGAKETLQKVASLEIPHLFFTNNGMETEAKRAERLGGLMGLNLLPEKFVLCHSALKNQAVAIGEGLVLVTGYCRMDSVELMKSLGFKNVHTMDAYAACHPELCPLKTYPVVVDRGWANQQVEMIVLSETSMNWAQDIQIICDLMMYSGHTSLAAAQHSKSRNRPKLIGCNFDFTYVGAHDAVRLGPGAFVEALSCVYTQSTGGERLEFIRHGKPHRPMYDVAEERLRSQMPQQQSKTDLRRIYAIGDNPQSDIRGANNAGEHWKSILVRTGCFEGKDNDHTDPADHVADDVSSAVTWILRIENQL